MKRNKLVLTFGLVGLILLLLPGCRQQVVVAPGVEQKAELPAGFPQSPKPARISPEPAPAPESLSPRISFEKTIHNLGEVGPNTKNTCEFKFTNTGSSLLRIGKIKSTCGCTATRLSRKEYTPDETGVIKVSYHAGKSIGPSQKRIYVSSNDKDNPKIKLTIKARVVKKVEVSPQKLELSLRKENAGMPDITLRSKDGKPFSIEDFGSTNSSIVADFDTEISASEFVLHPKVDIEKLRAGLNGRVEIRLTHPGCRSVRIPYKLLGEFKAIPASINILNAEPEKAATREITVVSNYDEDFEVESASSKKGTIELLSREKVGDRYKLKLKIMPPPITHRPRIFSDVFYVNLKSSENQKETTRLSISCRGSYSRRAKKH